MGRYRYLWLKEKDWKARRSKSSSYSPKKIDKFGRENSKLLGMQQPALNTVGKVKSYSGKTVPERNLHFQIPNYRETTTRNRNVSETQRCVSFFSCVQSELSDWHQFLQENDIFLMDNVLTRQIDEEFQAFSLITSFSFCNGIKT